ncbi:peptidoglycan DD-metalloendopeptidase family protein [Mucilaginibacter terrae]|uniref:peptidoglycan DD-metalloendopeptidase family protein n=1 Tax=Mucilaginibacter terrae TaxID=1955052 RepID=UPI003636AA07
MPFDLKYFSCVLLVSIVLFSCSKNTGPLAIFNKLSPHDAYGQRLKDAGLDKTAMGSAWIQKGQASITNALNVSIPYKETGYFSAEKIPSATLRFDVKRGQKLHITLSKRPLLNFAIYMDLLEEISSTEQKLIASADTTGATLDHEVKQNGKYILRLQPELLRSGEYTLTITSGPSLSFPVSSTGKPNVGSFWGDGRDNGGRKHEGIDIFAPKRTPAIAAADGVVTSVSTNELGGLVVFMRPTDRDYTLYYAHLDQQLAQNGQTVHIGDTLGLVGNTGNARSTPSHLHFGIYTNGGAIDPYPFVNRTVQSPKAITASLQLLNATARTTSKTNRLYIEPDKDAHIRQTLPVSTVLNIIAATEGWYKATLPDGTQGYINSRDVNTTSTLRKLNLKQQQALLDAPDSLNAARKTLLVIGDQVNIKGSFRNYYLVTDQYDNTGWIEVH